MKAVSLDVNFDIGSSFSAFHAIDPYLYVPLHKHEEHELLYMIKSEGTRIVGDSIEKYFPGELVMIGPGIPHVWKCNENYVTNANLYAEHVCICFKKEIFGNSLLNLPEMANIKKIFELSYRGIKINGENSSLFGELMAEIPCYTGSKKILKLLEILDEISRTEKYQLLASETFVRSKVSKQDLRIRMVYEYVLKNFRRKLYLEEVASLANMSPNAFSRFFKMNTNKNFSQFVNEIRVGHACKLLMRQQYSISRVSYESGFNNVTNFNKQFKKIIKHTPLEYQKFYY